MPDITPHELRSYASLLLAPDVAGSSWFVRCVGRQLLAQLSGAGSTKEADAASLLPRGIRSLISDSDISQAVRELEDGGLIHLVDSELYASGSGRNLVTQRRSDSEAREFELGKRFLMELQNSAGALPHGDHWITFRDSVLVPSALQPAERIAELGTNIAIPSEAPEDLMQGYLETLDGALTIADLRNVVELSLNPADRIVSEYLASLVGAAMYSTALHLSEPARSVLVGQMQPLTLILDTNVLFSVVKAHENPANEAVQSLVAAVTRSDTGSVHLTYLPESLAEARRVIMARQYEWATERGVSSLSPAVARGMLTQDLLYGLNAGFVSYVAAQQRPTSPFSYFQRLHDNLPTVLETHGISPLEAQAQVKPDSDADRARLRLLTTAEIRGHRKTPNQRRHDYILRETCRRLRSPNSNTPTTAGYWVVTADWELVDWDKHASRVDGELRCVLQIGGSLTLVTRLLPPSRQLEAALAAVVQHPLLYTEYDNEAEALLIGVGIRLDNARAWAENDADIVASIIANESVQMLIMTKRERDGDATPSLDSNTNDVLADAVSDAMSSIDARTLELEAKLTEVRQLEATAVGPDHEPPTASEENSVMDLLEEQLDQAVTQRDELAEVKKNLTARVAVLESDVSGLRHILRRSLPIWLTGVLVSVLGSMALLNTVGLTYGQTALLALPTLVWFTSLGIRWGPSRWSSGTIGRAAAAISRVVVLIVLNVVAVAFVAFFEILAKSG